jgi:hypothetical protein
VSGPTCHQPSCDCERYYVSGSTAFYVYTKDGELLASNEEPFVDLEKPANHIGDSVGEIEGIDFDPEAGEMVVLANRGKRIVLGMPTGLYPGYEREIHEVSVYRVLTR